MQVEPDTIYLMPPKHEMTIRAGGCSSTERDPAGACPCRSTPSSARWPRTSAPARSPWSCRAPAATARAASGPIHEAGGLVIAQSEDSAKFDGMPRSAIDTGVVDLVLAPEDIGRRPGPLPAEHDGRPGIPRTPADGRGRCAGAHLRAAAAGVRHRLRRLQGQHGGPPDRAPAAAERQPRPGRVPAAHRRRIPASCARSTRTC